MTLDPRPSPQRLKPNRSLATRALWLAVAVSTRLPGPAWAAGPRAKKLIEFGWDEPDTAFMRQHAAELERTPFDGCVFHVSCPKAGGGQSSFTWESWGQKAFTSADLAPAIADLKATPFRRFKENFLRFNTTPAKLDWFDDHSAVTNNARLAAWAARQGRCKGLLFDIEHLDLQRDAALVVGRGQTGQAPVRLSGRVAPCP